MGHWLGLGEFKVRVQKQARLMHASLVVIVKGEVKIKKHYPNLKIFVYVVPRLSTMFGLLVCWSRQNIVAFIIGSGVIIMNR